MIAVEAVQAIVGTQPDKPPAILMYALYVSVGKSFSDVVRSYVQRTFLRRAGHAGGEQRKQERKAYTG